MSSSLRIPPSSASGRMARDAGVLSSSLAQSVPPRFNHAAENTVYHGRRPSHSTALIRDPSLFQLRANLPKAPSALAKPSHHSNRLLFLGIQNEARAVRVEIKAEWNPSAYSPTLRSHVTHRDLGSL